MNKTAILALEDGTVFRGRSVGAPGESTGELVFNTSMTGYQEILTDPSYKGQMVVMTYPLIGNYGINTEDMESRKPFLEALILRESSRIPSNFRSSLPLPDYLENNNVLGVDGIDTRALTKKIRTAGSLRAIISTEETNADTLVDKAKTSIGLEGRDLAREVTCEEPYAWSKGYESFQPAIDEFRGRRYPVVAMDFGTKHNILRSLTVHGFDVTVVPADASAEKILGFQPAALFLSNGPGDPAALSYAFHTIEGLLGKFPIMGICLGHQILAQALGAKTFKMKFGHHGANHPVKDLQTGKIEITSQNHSFAVDVEHGMKGVEATHVNLNDGTNEGIRHLELPAFSVQYHPEAAPGPHDSLYLFKRFREMIEKFHG